MVHRVRHQRYLTMAASIGNKGGGLTLNAAGKISNAVPLEKIDRLIPPGAEFRGRVIYLSFEPDYGTVEVWSILGIKEIYFAAEVNSVRNTSHGTRLEGINYDDEIAGLQRDLGQ